MSNRPLRTPLRTFTTDRGRTFAVRVLPTGAQYGADNWLEATVPMVEFYATWYADDAFPGEAGGFGLLGQFVTRYNLVTLLGLDAYGHKSGGVDLHGGVPAWTVDDRTMGEIRGWLAPIAAEWGVVEEKPPGLGGG